MSGGSSPAPATTIAVKESIDRLRPKTWRFDLTLQTPPLSGPDDVCALFRSILDDAQFSAGRCSIHALNQCSFAFGVPEGDVAKISGYLHSSEKITEAAVRTWLFDDRIHGEIKWTAVLPGKYRDWKKHEHLADIFATCNGGGRRIEHWMSSDPPDKGGRPRKTPAPADGGPGGAAASVSRPRGRPPNPPLVAADSPEQAAVRARLHAMSADSVGDLCGVLLPQDRSWVGQPKLSQVEKLMAIHNEELARLLGIAPAGTLPAAPPPVPAADTPAQAALSARLRELPRRKLADVCRSVFPPTDFGWCCLSSKQRPPPRPGAGAAAGVPAVATLSLFCMGRRRPAVAAIDGRVPAAIYSRGGVSSSVAVAFCCRFLAQ